VFRIIRLSDYPAELYPSGALALFLYFLILLFCFFFFSFFRFFFLCLLLFVFFSFRQMFFFVVGLKLRDFIGQEFLKASLNHSLTPGFVGQLIHSRRVDVPPPCLVVRAQSPCLVIQAQSPCRPGCLSKCTIPLSLSCFSLKNAFSSATETHSLPP